MAAIVPAPPKVKEIKSQGATGGAQAPSGPSVAAKMVKGARNAPRQRANIPRSRGQRSASRGRVPRSSPYNPLESPYKNQGQFELGVAKQAKTEYEPKLSAIGSEEQGETGLHSQREADNVNIYKQYSEQANAAFGQAKGAMAEIAARQNASTASGQQALQAALSNTGVAGLQGVANQGQFMQEATGLGSQSSQTLAGEQSGLTGEMAKNLSVPGVGLQEASGAEQQRSSGILNKLHGERQKVTGEIPNFIAKARNELSKQEQERQANKLQARIAQQKLGIEKESKVEAVKERSALIRESSKEKNEALEAAKRQELGIKEEAVQNQKKALEERARTAKGKEQKVAAEIAAKRYDNGLKIMAGYLKGIKTNAWPAGAHPTAEEAAKYKWTHEERADAQTLYTQLTEQGNLTAPEAFRIMKSSGNGYIEKFAQEHERIYNAANRARHQPLPTLNRNAPHAPIKIPRK